MIHVQKDLLPKSIWLACSGGVDSIAAAHLLAVKMGYDVKIWHFNHKLRLQNEYMHKAVRAFCNKFNLPYVISTRNSLIKIEDSEAAFREQRIGHLVSDVDVDSIVVMCHHLDDCVESYLMNCFNGTPEYCPIPISSDFGRTTLVRPFLLTPKEKLEEYAQQNDLWKFIVEDGSNKNLKYRRNWVRHRCRPVIEKKYPGLQKVVRKKMISAYRKELDDPRA